MELIVGMDGAAMIQITQSVALTMISSQLISGVQLMLIPALNLPRLSQKLLQNGKHDFLSFIHDSCYVMYVVHIFDLCIKVNKIEV